MPGAVAPDAGGSVATQRRRTGRAVLLACLLVSGLLVGVAVRRQAPWVPWPYLLVGMATTITAVALVAWPRRLTRWHVAGTAMCALAAVALLPVPWMTAAVDHPPGTAWRLDGNLVIDGAVVDPPGAWYWLTVGRPPIVLEVVRGWVSDEGGGRDLRAGGSVHRPGLNEPAAVAVGLRAAGREIPFDLVVELSRPTLPGLPDHVVVASLNGTDIVNRHGWASALETLSIANSLVTGTGREVSFDGASLPYERVELLDVPVHRIDAMVGGRWARTPPGRWFRNLSVGRSHGLMVALVTYAHASGEDLARGRTIAGTGGIAGDGTVHRIGGVRAKAQAAVRAGADVLLVPAEQADALADIDLGHTRLVPVNDLSEAIAALRE